MSTLAELYIVMETSTVATAEAQLRAVLGLSKIASVLIMPASGTALTAPDAKRLVDMIQAKGAAALLADDANLVRTLKADGVHLSWSKDQRSRFEEARQILGERYIVGADVGRSRHDAMELGEAGADYIAFGIPEHVTDRLTASERQLDLIGWWGEIFQIPCVAFDVEGAPAANALGLARADFVAVTIKPSMSPEDAARKIADFAAALSFDEAPA